MFNAGSIFAKLGINTSEFQANIKGATASLTSFANTTTSSMGGVAAASGSLGNTVKGIVSPLAQTGTESRNLGNAFTNLKGHMSGLNGIGSELTQTFKQALGMASVAVVMIKLKNEFMASVEAAAEFESAMIGLSSVAQAFSIDATEAKDAAQSLSKDGLLSVKESADGLKNLLATGFSMPEAINLMNGFKDAAAFNRQGTLAFGEAIVGATQGLKNQNSIMVDNAGITKNLSNILKEQGLSVNDLSKVTSDATVRQKLYNGLLQETAVFSGDAERAASTYQGRMAQLNTAIFNLRKEIGAQLLPVLSSFIQDGTESANTAANAASKTQGFGMAVYVLGNLLKGLGLGIATIVKSLTAVGYAFYGAGRAIYNFVTDAIHNFKSVGTALFALGHMIKGVLTGNLGEAQMALNQLSSVGFAKFSSGISQVSLTLGYMAEDITTSFNAAKDAFTNAFTLSGFEQLTNGATDFDKAAKSAGNSVEEALDKVKNSDDAKDAIDGVKDALGLLKDKAKDIFSTFKERRKDVLDAMESMKTGVNDLRKEIKQIKADSRDAIDALKEQFQIDKDELKTNLGENIGKELLALEKTVSENSAEIVDIQNDAATEIAEINADLYDEEIEAQEEYAKDSAEIEKDRLEKIAEINEKRDYTEYEKDAAEEIAKIRNSISDYSTQAERDEAEERAAIIEQEKQDKIDKLNAELDDEIADITTAAEEKQSALQAALEKELTDAREKAAEAVAIQEKESADKIAILQQEIDEANAIMAANQATFTAYSDAILEARRVASLDAIQVLMEQFATEKAALKTKLEEDIQTEKDARDQKITDAKEAFAEEMEINVKNLEDLDKFWKKKENKYQDHLDTIAHKRKKALDKLDEEFTAAFEAFDAKTGGSLTKQAGGTDIEISKDKSGNAQITIENMNVSNESDINTLVTRLTNLLNAATA